jgi:TolB-like protein
MEEGDSANTLLAVPQLTGPAVQAIPTVAIHPVANETRHDFDGGLLVRRIRQRLTEIANGRVLFVTRDDRDLDVIERERVDKRAGEYSSKKQETKTGADFYLTGKATAISKTGGGMSSDAIWIDFQLIDAENGELVWEDTYKTKKVGPDRVRYR